uniref:Uncharacterized protein n=1 Tax=Phaeomonas parva TaxID=124430 RepID=A0A7S1TWF1_9STRA|eukprot:CAMPEP_0118885524 /NCGR_PEP_ID=MMETSP1163-20130328/23967_1 /TAXON_ID=124430 /ORGANISM="Phaeomonas parva, Strain CCMP2877" /LENGTH=623 /DNA_ID=CAMNT_0006823557 /DNA_START=109 /DNA_END=1980 /DNA_ORIENTATION=-
MGGGGRRAPLTALTLALLCGLEGGTALRSRLLPRRRSVLQRWSTKTDDEANQGLRERLKVRPDHPRDGKADYAMWCGAFKTQAEEYDYELPAGDVIGEVPADLVGTVFRNVPSRFDRGSTDYGHFLDGDGKIIKLTFRGDGSVRFQNSFVKTREFQEEEAAGEVLYRTAFRTQRKPRPVTLGPLNVEVDAANFMDLWIKNGANTNVLHWGDRLLAFYEAGVPYRMDPTTLETLGADDMGLGADLREGIAVDIAGLPLPGLGSYATAHPKVADVARSRETGRPKDERLISFTWNASPKPVLKFTSDAATEDGRRDEIGRNLMKTELQVYMWEWDEDFRLVQGPLKHSFRNTQIVPHDFSITENYYVFVESRVSGSQVPYILGRCNAGECVAVDSDKNMQLHVVPRDGSEARVRELAPGFTIHSPAAFEEDGKLHLWTTGWRAENVTRGETGGGGLLGAWEGTAPDFERTPQTLLYHTVYDIEQDKVEAHGVSLGLEVVGIDHPHINPEFEGSKFRYMWMQLAGQGTEKSAPGVGILRYDIETGAKEEWYAPQHLFTEEPIVIPRGSGKEDDVYVLHSYYDAVLDRSGAYIFDGRSVEAGPLCNIVYPHAIPHGLHGSYSSQIFE